MGYFQRYGSIKPGITTQMDWEHPFSSGLIFTIPFNNEVGSNIAVHSPSSLIISGSATPLQLDITTHTATWTSNYEGVALQCASDTRLNISASPAAIFLPTSAITISFIRRRTSATLGDRVAHADSGLDIYAPYSDGTVYWDFGGSGSPNRLSVGGLSFSTTIPERWIFTAGPRGSSIWKNGIRVANQTTGISRSIGVSGEVLTLNYNDYNEFNFFQANNQQWSDNLCQWWSASPYEHLYSETFGNKFFFLGALSSDVTGTLTETIPLVGLTGVGSYQDNQSNTQIQPPGNITLPIRQFERV